MGTRGRVYKNQDWDPMRDEYNNSTYEAQYADDEASEGAQLNYKRLYITNIPVGLNKDGLQAAFGKYGNVVEAFVSSDPTKRYAMISFETASEAKLAMMKMNKTEPLKLNLTFAYHKPTKKPSTSQNNNIKSHKNSKTEQSYYKDEALSEGGRSRHSRKEEINNGDEISNGFPVEDDMSLTDALDPNWSLEMESLKLEHLKLREEQLLCKQRMMLLKQNEKKSAQQSSTSTRCVLPDGRVVVRNAERPIEPRDADVTYAAGAGDSSQVPGLQRECVRACVRCGRAADAYCARCGLAPYCSATCQRRDWVDRHRDVCHNLARLPHHKIAQELSNLPQAPPLRRPHSPGPRAQPEKDVKNDDSESEKANKNYRQGAKNNGNATNRFNQRNLSSFVKRQPARHNKDNQEAEIKHNQQQQSPQKPEKQQPQIQQPEKQQQKQQPQKQQPESPPTTNNNDAEKAKNTQALAQLRRPKTVTNVPEVVKEEPKPIAPKVQIQEPVKVKPSPPVKEEPELVPKTYMLQHLSVGDSVLLSVEQVASACRTTKPGFVCLAMHDKYEGDYQKLCEDYVLDCEADDKPYSITPGATLSYLNPCDGGWYRARCLITDTIALLDATKITTITPQDKCKQLPDKYADIPEFSCLLDSKDVEIGANIKCTLMSKTPAGFKVTIYDVDSDAELGSGEVMRWIPDVEYPQKTVAVPPSKPVPQLPEPVRPDLQSKRQYIVCDYTGGRVCVRPADESQQAAFHAVMEDVAIYGAGNTQPYTSPLQSPPSAGSVVVAQYTDGLHYRAIVQRTSVHTNRYMIQYLEYGNVEVTQLARLYECPSQFDSTSVPPVTSILTLDAPTPLTAAAEEYLQQIKEQEVVLTLPDGAETAPSGSVANLTLVKDKEDVSAKLRELCTPHWKTIELRGGDVLALPAIMYEELSCCELPAAGTLRVLDASLLEEGTLCVCAADNPQLQLVDNQLADWMAEYCNSALGREPYLPKTLELCIAYIEEDKKWRRAAVLEQTPGAPTARLLLVDSGRVLAARATLLRKALPEFVNGLPAVAAHLDINEFPRQARAVQAARRLLAASSELAVTNCVKLDDGLYRADAPLLLRAMAVA